MYYVQDMLQKMDNVRQHVLGNFTKIDSTKRANTRFYCVTQHNCYIGNYNDTDTLGTLLIIPDRAQHVLM